MEWNPRCCPWLPREEKRPAGVVFPNGTALEADGMRSAVGISELPFRFWCTTGSTRHALSRTGVARHGSQEAPP